MKRIGIGLVAAVVLTLAVVGLAAARNPCNCPAGCPAWPGCGGGPPVAHGGPCPGGCFVVIRDGGPFSDFGVGPYTRFGGGYIIGGFEPGPYMRFGGYYVSGAYPEGPYQRFGGGYILGPGQ